MARGYFEIEATISGGPNFAYELCARKITEEQRIALDLSSWRLAYDGAEPVRADTLKRFAAAFASCGFRPNFFYPCYGLAEATLIVSGGLVKDEPILRTIQVSELEHNHNGVVGTPDRRVNLRTLVGCGHAVADTKIVIVNPVSLTACAPDEVGEIWVSAPAWPKAIGTGLRKRRSPSAPILPTPEKDRFSAPEIWDSSEMGNYSSLVG